MTALQSFRVQGLRPLTAPALAAMVLAWLVGSAMPAHADPLAAPVPMTQFSPGTVSGEVVVPGNAIFRSVTADGRVVFGDQPEPGARETSATRFMSYSTPEALSRARQERDYWRAQAQALNQRQQARALADARLQMQRDQARARAQGPQPVEYVWRPVVGLRNFPPVPFTGAAPLHPGASGPFSQRLPVPRGAGSTR